MMRAFLGIDTSNYTTSAALYLAAENLVIQKKQLLPVRDGSIGLRQGDAVFHHVQQLGNLISSLRRECGAPIAAVGVSVKPRNIEGSYMPCFLVGKMAAQTIGAALQVPVLEFSHQDGHIMAALYGAEVMQWANKEFIGFHFSGGTSECLWVRHGIEKPFDIRLEATSLDLKAGQAIDRIGVRMGLPFPAGRYIENFALQSSRTFKIRPAFKGENCCFSGLENQCTAMLERGESKEDTAKFCLDYIGAVVDKMTSDALKRHPGANVLYAGGVMSNSLLRKKLKQQYNGYFAPPEFSADNAAGVAILAASQSREKWRI